MNIYKLLIFSFFPLFLCAQTATKIESINSNEISIIEAAPSGKIWVGTNGNGCVMVDPLINKSTLFDKTNSALRSDTLTAIAFKEIGGVLHSFMATPLGVAYLHGGKWDTLANLPPSRVTSIAVGIYGAIMIATRDSGIAIFDTTLKFVKMLNKSNTSGFLTNRINAFSRRNVICNNILPFATDSGYCEITYDPDLNFSPVVTVNAASNIIPSDKVQVLNITTNKTCDTVIAYIGTNLGITISNSVNPPDSLIKLSKSTGLPSNDITSLELDKNGTLWIGTRDAGVACYKSGNITKIDMSNGLLSNKVSAINCSSPTNDCWVASPDKGIVSIGLDFNVKQKITLGITNSSSNRIIVSAFPQPANEQINFVLPSMMSNISVKLYNLTSGIVKEFSMQDTDKFNINISDLPQGMYAYKLEGNQINIATGRIAVIR